MGHNQSLNIIYYYLINCYTLSELLYIIINHGARGSQGWTLRGADS